MSIKTEMLHESAIGSALGVALICAVTTTGSAFSQPLPPAQFLQTVDVENPTLTPPLNDLFYCSGTAFSLCDAGTGLGTLSGGSLSDYGSLGSVKTVNPAGSALTISSSSSGGGVARASADGEADYYLELTGPATFIDGTTPVRVDVTAHADVSLSDPYTGLTGDYWASANASAGIDIEKPVGQSPFGTVYQSVLASFSVFSPSADLPTSVDAAAGDQWCFEKTCVESADLSKNMLFLLQPNIQYLVTVFANTQTADSSGNQIGDSSQTANASVDPHFYLDPVYSNPDDILLLSSNVSNFAPGSGGVPEPSTWALLGIGFCWVALRLSARQRQADSSRIGTRAFAFSRRSIGFAYLYAKLIGNDVGLGR